MKERSSRQEIVASRNDNQALLAWFIHGIRDCEQCGWQLDCTNELEWIKMEIQRDLEEVESTR